MDFSYLLELAKANEEKTKNDNSFKFSTTVSGAKRVAKSGPKPQAINQLLNKMEEEKKKKSEEFNKKRDVLLALRANDKHSKKRVHSLINRTKGASKAVLDDAKDLTTAKGEEQCDEDDYGYESTLSQQIFSKLQNTYSELPEDERLKFHKTQKSSIEDIKNRVMSSLKQKQEEELGLRKRKRNRKSKTAEEDDGFINDGDAYKKFAGQEGAENIKEEERARTSEKTEEKKKKKKKHSKHDIDNSLNQKTDKYAHFKYDKEKRKEETPSEKVKETPSEKVKKKKPAKNAPPPMSFEELMKVAQKKQKEPVPIYDPLQELLKRREENKNKKCEERLLTAKEKEELDEEKLRRLKKVEKVALDKAPSKSKDGKKDARSDLKGANEKFSREKSLPEQSKQISKENKHLPELQKKVSKITKSLPEQSKSISDKSKYFAVPFSEQSKKISKENKPLPELPNKISKDTKNLPEQPKPIKDGSKYFAVIKPQASKNVASGPESAGKAVNKIKGDKEPQPKVKSKKEAPAKHFSNPYLDPKPKKETSAKHFSNPYLDPRPKKEVLPKHVSNPYLERRSAPAPQPKQKTFKRRLDSDEEDENDSEMDDFIDDDDGGDEYSREMAALFKGNKMFSKYNESRYRHADDDDDSTDDMEASFGQLEKEEIYSAKIGLMEDLEDMKMEEEEKKRKRMLKKKRKL